MGPKETETKNPAPAVSDAAWEQVLDLSCTLSVALEVPRLTVSRLLGLELNSVLDSQHNEDSTLPIWVNGVKIGQAEFDVIGDRLIMRMTETS